MSRKELRRRLRDAIGRHRAKVPDWLDTCAECGDAIDEPLGRNGKRAHLCRRCALEQEDARHEGRAAS